MAAISAEFGGFALPVPDLCHIPQPIQTTTTAAASAAQRFKVRVVAVRGFHSQEVPGVRYPCAVGGGGGGGGGRHPPLLYVADAGSAVGDGSTDTVVAVKSPWASSSL